MGTVCSACTEKDKEADTKFGKAKPELGTTPKTKDGAVKLYDDWAEDYDETLKSWGYVAHDRCAEMLKEFCVASKPPAFSSKDERVLDAGCGTGISGEALQRQGFLRVTGLDVSPASLDLIKQKKPGLYEELGVADLDVALKFPDNAFAGAVCVGVLSYVNNYEGLFSEWCRTLRKGGLVVFTHRQGQGPALDDAATNLEKAGKWKKLKETGPMDYMPKNPEKEEREKKIKYYVFQIC